MGGRRDNFGNCAFGNCIMDFSTFVRGSSDSILGIGQGSSTAMAVASNLDVYYYNFACQQNVTTCV